MGSTMHLKANFHHDFGLRKDEKLCYQRKKKILFSRIKIVSDKGVLRLAYSQRKGLDPFAKHNFSLYNIIGKYKGYIKIALVALS